MSLPQGRHQPPWCACFYLCLPNWGCSLTAPSQLLTRLPACPPLPQTALVSAERLAQEWGSTAGGFGQTLVLASVQRHQCWCKGDDWHSRSSYAAVQLMLPASVSRTTGIGLRLLFLPYPRGPERSCCCQLVETILTCMNQRSVSAEQESNVPYYLGAAKRQWSDMVANREGEGGGRGGGEAHTHTYTHLASFSWLQHCQNHFLAVPLKRTVLFIMKRNVLSPRINFSPRWSNCC